MLVFGYQQWVRHHTACVNAECPYSQGKHKNLLDGDISKNHVKVSTSANFFSTNTIQGTTFGEVISPLMESIVVGEQYEKLTNSGSPND